MRKIAYVFLTLIAALCLASCDECVKKTSKKVTEIGLGVVDGVREAIEEHGWTAEACESAVQRIEESVSDVDDSAKVRYVQEFDKDALSKHYDRIRFIYDNTAKTEGPDIEFLGKAKSKPVIDVIIQLHNTWNYNVRLKFISERNEVLIEKSVNVARENAGSPEYALVSFALDENELPKLDSTSVVKVSADGVIIQCF